MKKPGNTKKIRTRANALGFTALAVICLICLNIVGNRLFGRVDLTEDRIYTLSPSSRQLVANLPDRIVAKAFISKDMPPQIGQLGKYLRDLLDEYKASSKGKLEWEAIDPQDGKTEEDRRKKEEEASRLGVQKLQLQQLSKEKVSVGAIYLGVAFQYGDKTERLARVTQIEGLEYEISSILKRLTTKKKKVGFTSGHGEPDQSRGIQFVWNELGENYDVAAVNLGGDAPAAIADDIDALVIFGPTQPFSDGARKAIDQFLAKGRSAAFLVDGMTLEAPHGQMPPEMGGQMPKIARRNETGLDPLLSAYGFKINEDVILDEQSARGVVPVNGQLFLVNQPYFPIATRLGSHQVTEKLRGMVFPLASSVETQGPMKEKKAGELVPLAESTDRSWRQTGFFMLDPTHELKPAGERASYVFGYAYKGPLKSAYAGPQAPAMSSAGQDKPSAGEANVRLVVIGDSDFASDDAMRSPEIRGSNGHFFANIVDWLAQDEALAGVRGKGVTQRPLHYTSESTPTVVKTFNMFGLPLAFIGYGLVRWRRRARKQENPS